MRRTTCLTAALALLCASPSLGAIVTYRSIEVQSPAPTGAGGLRYYTNWKVLADRTWLHETAADPTANDDSAGTGGTICRESSLWKNTSTGVLYVCTDDTATAAVWAPLGGIASLSEGTAIDITSGSGPTSTVAFDSTELGTTTWGSGAGIVWTFDASAGDDPVFSFADNDLTLTDSDFGIGVAPDYPLEVYHATNNVLAEFESGDIGAWIILTDSTESWRLGSNGGVFYVYDEGGATYPITIEDNTPTNTLYLDSNARVGINESSPQAPLHVLSDASHKAIYLEENSGSEYFELGVDASGDLHFYDSGSIAVTIGDGTGWLGIGDDTPNAMVHAANTAMDRSGSFDGFMGDFTKTAGATTEGSDYKGIDVELELNQAGGTIGHMWAADFGAILTDGTIGDGQEDLRAINLSTDMDGGTAGDDVYTVRAVANLDAGTITNNIYGTYNAIDAEAAMTSVGGDVYGAYHWVDMDVDPVGTATILWLQEGSNIDYALYHDGTANSYLGGRLGIGDDSPDAQLDVETTLSSIAIFSGSTGAFHQIVVNAPTDADSQVAFQENEGTRWSIGIDGDDSDKFKWQPASGAFASAVMTLTTDGLLGINETSPQAPLHVLSDASHKAIYLEENSGSEYWEQGINADGDLVFYDTGSAEVTFGDGGNVGIGIADQSTSQLYVNQGHPEGATSRYAVRGAVNVKTVADEANYGLAVSGNTSDAVGTGFTNSGYVLGVRGRGYLIGDGTLSTAYGISGYVGTNTGGTGTVTNAYALYGRVYNGGSGTITNAYSLYLADADGTNQWGVYQVGADDDNYFAGAVGIGETNPQAPLHVLSDASHKAIYLEENSGSEYWEMGINADGDVVWYDTGAAAVTFGDGGNVGIGSGDIDGRTLYVAGTAREGGSTDYAMFGYMSSSTGANEANYPMGIFGRAYDAVGTGFTNSGSASGAYIEGFLTGDGTLTAAYGVRGYAGTGTGGTGTVNTAYALYGRVYNGGSGTITNGYGLYLADAAATNGWGVYQAGADDDNYFAGYTGFGQTSPQYPIDVNSTDSPLAHFHGSGAAYHRINVDVDASADSQVAFMEGSSVRWSIGNDGGDSDTFKWMPDTGVFDAATVMSLTSAGHLTAVGLEGDHYSSDSTQGATDADVSGLAFKDGLYVSGSVTDASLTVADTNDTTAYLGLWEDATGDLSPKTDAEITYNATTDTLTTTAAVLGDININATTGYITTTANDLWLDPAGTKDVIIGEATGAELQWDYPLHVTTQGVNLGKGIFIGYQDEGDGSDHPCFLQAAKNFSGDIGANFRFMKTEATFNAQNTGGNMIADVHTFKFDGTTTYTQADVRGFMSQLESDNPNFTLTEYRSIDTGYVTGIGGGAFSGSLGTYIAVYVDDDAPGVATNAFSVYSEGESVLYHAGQVSIGTDTTPTAALLEVKDATYAPPGGGGTQKFINVTDITITDATAMLESDDVFGLYSSLRMNDAGTTVGHLNALRGHVNVSAGDVGDGQEDAVGGYFEAQASGGTIDHDLVAIRANCNADSGTVDGTAYAGRFVVDIESAMTKVDDIKGIQIWMDSGEDPTNSAIGLHIYETGGNIDRGVYQEGTAINEFGGDTGIGVTPVLPLHVLADAANWNVRLQENSGGEYWDMGVTATGVIKLTGDDANDYMSIDQATGGDITFTPATNGGVSFLGGTADGVDSLAWGVGADANGDDSFAFGDSTVTDGDDSVGWGSEAHTTIYGQHAHASGTFDAGDHGDAQTSVLVLRANTSSGDTQDIMSPNGGNNNILVVPANTIWAFELTVVASEDLGAAGAADSAHYTASGTISRDLNGATHTTALMSAITATVVEEDDASWDLTIVADDTNETLLITFTGDGTNNCQAVGRLVLTELTY